MHYVHGRSMLKGFHECTLPFNFCRLVIQLDMSYTREKMQARGNLLLQRTTMICIKSA